MTNTQEEKKEDSYLDGKIMLISFREEKPRKGLSPGRVDFFFQGSVHKLRMS